MSIKEWNETIVMPENQKKHLEAAHSFLANEQIKAQLSKTPGVLSLSSIILDDGQKLTFEDVDSFAAAPGIIFTKINPRIVEITASL